MERWECGDESPAGRFGRELLNPGNTVDAREPVYSELDPAHATMVAQALR